MVKALTTDVYFMKEPQPGALIEATAVAFGVPVESVVVAPVVSETGRVSVKDPAVAVLWRREVEDQGGDFPIRFNLMIPEEERGMIFDRLDGVETHLQIPFITDAENDYELRLYLPNGEVLVIPDTMSDDDEYEMHLTPAQLDAINRASIEAGARPRVSIAS
ncbi:MAG TPA: hypothetical protein VFQ54_02560 [Thermomicrobiales bacterium]|nr:hypothetical protein [Thermomicrobiales bacterium]